MHSKYLGDKPFWRVAIRLALPIAIQNMLTSSFALIDTLMVSQLGDVALSAVGMAGQWGWFMTIITFGVCSGMSVFAAQYWGVRNLKAMRRVLGLALCIGGVISLLFLLCAQCFPCRSFICSTKNRQSFRQRPITSESPVTPTLPLSSRSFFPVFCATLKRCRCRCMFLW